MSNPISDFVKVGHHKLETIETYRRLHCFNKWKHNIKKAKISKLPKILCMINYVKVVLNYIVKTALESKPRIKQNQTHCIVQSTYTNICQDHDILLLWRIALSMCARTLSEEKPRIHNQNATAATHQQLEWHLYDDTLQKRIWWQQWLSNAPNLYHISWL